MARNNLWHEAAAMAARAHRNQTRKDKKKTPYFSHPARVALTVAVKFGCTDEKVLAAALLHDVLEDTLVDYDDLLERFEDEELARMVFALSKDHRLPDAEKERKFDEQLAEATWQVRLIKLADVYDNLADAPDDQIKHKMLGKAERALGLAKNDPKLEKASAELQALADEAQRQLSA
jgi:guanosine-3',5'-bis(diphosphate) 3'-pyrophosphohydrolase